MGQAVREKKKVRKWLRRIIMLNKERRKKSRNGGGINE